MYWTIIYPSILLAGQVAATLLWHWTGYQAYMWAWIAWHLIYTSATSEDRLDSGGMTMPSAALSMVALTIGTWLLWDVVGDYLPHSALGTVLTWGGCAMAVIYATVGVVVGGPVALLWLLRKVAPNSVVTRAAFGAAERAAVWSIADDARALEAQQLPLRQPGASAAPTMHHATGQRRELAVR